MVNRALSDKTYLLLGLLSPLSVDKKTYDDDRPLSAYQKNNFLIAQPKHMLWVLKRTFSMRQFFWAPKTYAKTDELENIYTFTLKIFAYINQCDDDDDDVNSWVN